MKKILVIYECDNDCCGMDYEDWIEKEEFEIEDNVSLKEFKTKLEKELEKTWEKTLSAHRYGRRGVESVYEYTNKFE